MSQTQTPEHEIDTLMSVVSGITDDAVIRLIFWKHAITALLRNTDQFMFDGYAFSLEQVNEYTEGFQKWAAHYVDKTIEAVSDNTAPSYDVQSLLRCVLAQSGDSFYVHGCYCRTCSERRGQTFKTEEAAQT